MGFEYDEYISEWIEKNKDNILNDWIEICKIPAIKSEPKPGAPFGGENARALLKCTELFEKRGFISKMYKEDGYSLVSYGNGDKTIGIFTHSDVVPAGDGWIYTTPFNPVIKEGALIGRGVEDNKSGIMAALCVMEILREYNISLKSRIQLFIGSDEETGMDDIKSFAQNHLMPEFSIVPDADFPCSVGEKGICHFFAVSEGKLCDVIDFCGGEAFNIVLDNATALIKYNEKLYAELKEKTDGDKNFVLKCNDDKIELSACGIAMHASYPEGSVNAGKLLAGLLAEIESLCENDRKIMQSASHILSCPYGTSLGIDHCDSLFGRLTFVNGMINMDEGRLKLSFDMRYSSALNPENIFKKAKESLKALSWDTVLKDNSAGFLIDENSKIPETFERIYNELTGFDKKNIRLGGGTYARMLKNAFSVGTFTETADMKRKPLEMPKGHGGVHQCDEMIDIDCFFNAVKVIFYYLIEADKLS